LSDTQLANDRALVAAALAGDEPALGRLLASQQRAAYNTAYRLLGNEADARDAVQDGFVQAVRAVRHGTARPRSTDRFAAWLRRVVANAALAQLRRRPSFRAVPADEVAAPLPTPEHADPAWVAERREARGDILRALLTLPDAQRVALTLRESEGLPAVEIADLLGVSPNAVHMLLFRARRGFRAAYEGLGAEPQEVGCPQFRGLLAAAADEDLEVSAVGDLAAHLESCELCRRELDGLRRARRLAALLPLLATPADWNPVAAAIPAASDGVAKTTGAEVAAAETVPAATPAPVTAAAASAGFVAKLGGPAAAKAVAVALAAAIGVVAVAAPLVPTATDPVAAPTASARPAVPSPVVPLVPALSPSLVASPGSSPGVAPSPSPSPSPTGQR
jgi:RNA polymerase sigma-70 factor, ECF subfamily